MAEKLPFVLWDRPMLERLKERVEWAKHNHRESFEFDGRILLTTFARYLALYLEEVLK